MGKTCFFIGHREAGEEVTDRLAAEIERHITQCGVQDFVVGGYGGFDRLAARTVKKAKDKHPEITLTLLLPYHPAERPVETPPYFDRTFYPPGMEFVPHRVAIVRANRYMVDNSDYLIAYAWHPASNARELVEYAQHREKAGQICITLLEH